MKALYIIRATIGGVARIKRDKVYRKRGGSSFAMDLIYRMGRKTNVSRRMIHESEGEAGKTCD